MNESFWKNFESNDELPKLKKATPEDVEKVWKEVEYSNHLQKANDVLNVLWFPENKEVSIRKTLLNQDKKTLEELSKKTKNEILTFILNDKNTRKEEKTANIKNNDRLKETKQNSINSKLEKINSAFTPKILNNHPDISEKLNELSNLDTLSQTEQKEAIIQEVLDLLKQPWKLESIINEIGWANPSNPQYQEFKNTLISIDPSFKDIFPELEKIHNKTAFDTKEVFNVDGWIVNIDLKNEKTITKEIWSDYAFEDKLDVEALDNINSECIREVKEFKNGFAVLKGAYAPFANLLNQISSGKDIWELISNFDTSGIDKLEAVTNELNLDTDISLSSADIYELQNITDESELRLKLESIKQKFIVIANAMEKKEDKIKQKYHTEFAELLRQESESKELQVKVLKFFGDIGFDKISKTKSDVVVEYVNKNVWKLGLDSKMDFKNWNLGFNKDFWDREISALEKAEFIKLFNHMLWSEVVDENIAYGTSSLSNEAIWEIQRLNNRTVGFFVGNLEKSETS